MCFLHWFAMYICFAAFVEKTVSYISSYSSARIFQKETNGSVLLLSSKLKFDIFRLKQG